MATKKRDSRIIEEMLETARGLQGAGLITERRISEFEALSHLEDQEMLPY
jgi:putative transcriptional regulator